jgi:hypothetical protein
LKRLDYCYVGDKIYAAFDATNVKQIKREETKISEIFETSPKKEDIY